MAISRRKRVWLSVIALSASASLLGNAAQAACSYVVTNEWNNGATVEIRITNSTSSAVSNWSVNWQYSANRVSSSWNANVSGSNPYSATNLNWNGSIQPNQTVAFGLQVTKNNSNAAEVPTLSGSICSGSTPPPVSSVAASTASSAPSSFGNGLSSAPANCAEQCNWYGSPTPICTNVTNGWGYENNRSCVSRAVCTSQPAPYGVGNCGTNSSAPTSSSPVSSTGISSSQGSISPASSSARSSVVSSAGTISSSSAVSSSGATPTAGVFRVNTQGNITKDGLAIPARCGNWFGLEGRHEPSNDATNPSGAPMELYAGNMWWVNGGQGTGRTIQQTMTELKAQGINMIRLPITPQTLDPTDPQGRDPNLKNHESIRQTNARQAMEDFIKLADQNDLQVFIDIHSCSNWLGWRAGRLDARPPYVDANRVGYDFTREEYSCAATGNPNSVTKIHAYDRQKWLANLRDIAGLPAKLGVTNIVGIDVFNEPYDYTWADWKDLVEDAYAAINAVNPNLLIIVEGISAFADSQDGTPDTRTPVPHGREDLNPNWGENLYEAGSNPLDIPKDRLLFSPHTYGPSVFVQRHFMDPAEPQCEGLEGDEAGHNSCNVVINPELLEAGWEEHFGYLRELGYGMIVGEFGGNMDWPNKASQADRTTWSHITTNVDQQWQQAAASYFKRKNIHACYWSLNPESADTLGWYLTPWDPVSANDRWGEWTGFDPRRTQLLHTMWGI